MSSSVGSLTLQTTGAETGPICAAYSPSKTFLNAVTIQYARELDGTNILINAACPGYIATDFNGFAGYAHAASRARRSRSSSRPCPTTARTGGFFDDAGVVPW